MREYVRAVQYFILFRFYITRFLLQVEIASLKIEDTFYLPAETGNYSVAGFEMVLNR